MSGSLPLQHRCKPGGRRHSLTVAATRIVRVASLTLTCLE